MMMQLLFTSPHFEAFSVSEKPKMRWVLGLVAWTSFAFAASGIALAAEGLKLIDARAGAMLQWSLLGFGLPIMLLFLVVEIPRECTC